MNLTGGEGGRGSITTGSRRRRRRGEVDGTDN